MVYIQNLIILFVIVVLVFGQNDKFEYECDILDRLDSLEKKLEIAESKLEIAESRLEQQQSSAEQLQSSFEQQQSRLEQQQSSAEQQQVSLEIQQSSLEQQQSSLEQQNSSLEQQQREIDAMKEHISDAKVHQMTTGSTYVRWGRTSCPGNGTETVYSGYVGGSDHTTTGAAVDHLCLPQDPSYSHYEDGVQTGGFVYGAEYELHRTSKMSFFPENDPTVDLHDKDVPCAVCKSSRSSTIMVPARKTCHDGWTLEYQGYLFSGYSGHAAASEYVCLDGSPEYLVGGSSNDDGMLFYFVEARCGSLRCPPYVEGRELTCAVCSK